MTFSFNLLWYKNTHIQRNIFSHLPLSSFFKSFNLFFPTDTATLSFEIMLVISKIIKSRNENNKYNLQKQDWGQVSVRADHHCRAASRASLTVLGKAEEIQTQLVSSIIPIHSHQLNRRSDFFLFLKKLIRNSFGFTKSCEDHMESSHGPYNQFSLWQHLITVVHL